MTSEQFLILLNMSYVEYCSNEAKTFKFTMSKLKLIFLSWFMEILEYYWRDTTADDENFFTEEEVVNIIDHINEIMGTEYYFEF